MKSLKKRYLLILIIVILLPTCVFASDINSEAIQFGGGYNNVSDINSLEKYWESNDGLSFFINTPAGVGNL